MFIEKEITELISNGKITKAIKIFVEYIRENNEDFLAKALELKDRNKKNRTDKTLDRITLEIFEKEAKALTDDLLLFVNQIKEEKKEIIELDDLLIPKKIFISYNKTELKTANLLKDVLIENGAIDIIDLENKNGENISELISQQIEKADVTLSIISNKPRESAWIAMDTIDAFYSSEKEKEKTFIAVYLDGDFFDWRYQMDGNLKLSKKIKEIDILLAKGLELGNEFLILSNEKKRFLNLKNNLGDILKKIKEATIFDIRGKYFKKNTAKIIKSIRK